MIAYLQGEVLSKDEIIGTVILSVNGVGYELLCSQNSLCSIQKGQSVNLWVYTHVREDQLQLFGFCQKKEKQLFLSLLKVNGVGAKSALNILSASSVDKLISMIEQEDMNSLVRLPKIGKKTAEQIMLSLKGKLIWSDSPTQSLKHKARDEIVSALVNLGFKLPDVEIVAEQMDSKVGLQQGIREGLAALAKN